MANLVAGKIVLKVFISASGDVDAIQVSQSSLPEIYGTEALDAFKSIRFEPGRLADGRPVPSIIYIEVEFNGEKRP